MFRPKASVRELMVLGRLFVIVMVGLSIAWVSPALDVFYLYLLSGFEISA